MGNQFHPEIEAFNRFYTQREYSLDDRTNTIAILEERKKQPSDKLRTKNNWVWTWRVEHIDSGAHVSGGVCPTQSAARRKARETALALPAKDGTR